MARVEDAVGSPRARRRPRRTGMLPSLLQKGCHPVPGGPWRRSRPVRSASQVAAAILTTRTRPFCQQWGVCVPYRQDARDRSRSPQAVGGDDGSRLLRYADDCAHRLSTDGRAWNSQPLPLSNPSSTSKGAPEAMPGIRGSRARTSSATERRPRRSAGVRMGASRWVRRRTTPPESGRAVKRSSRDGDSSPSAPPSRG